MIAREAASVRSHSAQNRRSNHPPLPPHAGGRSGAAYRDFLLEDQGDREISVDAAAADSTNSPRTLILAVAYSSPEISSLRDRRGAATQTDAADRVFLFTRGVQTLGWDHVNSYACISVILKNKKRKRKQTAFLLQCKR